MHGIWHNILINFLRVSFNLFSSRWMYCSRRERLAKVHQSVWKGHLHTGAIPFSLWNWYRNHQNGVTELSPWTDIPHLAEVETQKRTKGNDWSSSRGLATMWKGNRDHRRLGRFPRRSNIHGGSNNLKSFISQVLQLLRENIIQIPEQLYIHVPIIC